VHIKFLGLLLSLAVMVSCASSHKAILDLGSPSQQSTNSSENKGSPQQVPKGQSEPNNSQPPLDSISSKWTRDVIDTTANAEYLAEIERQVILEINMVRTDPPEYARRYLLPMRSYYHDTLLQFPGGISVSTKEGLRALDECIQALQAAKSLLPLSPNKGLTLAARDHVKDHGRTGAIGHTGSDSSTVVDRFNRYGKWGISVGENIYYGNGNARIIVVLLLIDDGVSSRGHRGNFLNSSFKVVGVSVGPHPLYGYMCVMDFAGSYE